MKFTEFINFKFKKYKRYRNFKKKILKNCKYYDKENDVTKIPKGESISLNCIWIIEIYTPDTINKLISNLNKLNWNRSLFSAHEDNLSNIIKNVRGKGTRSWHNFGYILSRNTKSIFETKQSDIPEGVYMIKLTMINSTASITTLIYKFILSQDSRLIYKTILNKEYLTFAKKITNGFTYITPYAQKSDAIKNSREILTLNCKKWIKKNLGGFYTSNNLLAEMPIYDFLTVENVNLFSYNKISIFDYKHILHIDTTKNIWSINDIHGLFLRFKTSMSNSPASVTLIGNIEDILKEKNLSNYGSDKFIQIINYLDDFDKTLAIFALYNLQNTFKAQISKIRDKISNIDLSKTKKANISFSRISTEFAKLDGNITYFSNELKDLCKNKNIFMHDVYSMTTYDDNSLDREELINSIRKSLLQDSIILEKTHNNLRSVFHTSSQIVNSLSSEKLSRRNFWLQIFMALLTLAMLLLTYVSLDNTVNVQNFINNLISCIYIYLF